MAGRISGITIEIGGDTTKLQTALKGVDSTLKTTQRNLKDIDKLLKFNPASTELLRQKQKNLSTAIKTTEDRLKELKNAQSGVAEGTEEWDALQREIIATEQELQRLQQEYRNFGSVASQQIKVAGEKLTNIGKKTAEIGDNLTKKVTVPIVAGFGAAIKTTADFDSKMSEVAATMGTTTDSIGELRDFAREMGATTAFSASEAAEAMNYMALAGYNTTDIMSMLPTVLNLAAAGGIDLASASDMVTDAQSALGLTMDETTTMVDQMAKASSKSNTSVAQLGEAILTIGATARNVSGGTQELATVLGVLADNGIKGAEGGTHLRNIMLSLQDAAENGSVKFGDFSVSIYDADGNMRSMVDIIGDIQGGMEGMTQESKDAITSGVFNKTDLAAVNALLGTSKDRFDELGSAIAGSAGAAGEMAGTKLDNLNGQLTLLKSAVQELAISFGDMLMPYISKAVKFVQGLVDKFNALSPATKQTIAKIALVAAAIGPILAIGGRLLVGIGRVLMFAPMVASAVSAISLPMIGIVAIIAAVVAAGILLYKNWDTIKAKAIEFKDGVVAGWNQLKADTVAAWNNMVTSVVTAWNNLKTSVSTAVETLKADIAAKWDAIKADVSAKVEAIKTDVVSKWSTLISTVSNIWNSIKAAISNAINGAVSVVKSGVEKLKNALKFQWSLPHLKLPHISVTGGEPPYGIGGKGSLPQFSIAWYRKAYDNPVLFNSPTVVPTPDGLKGFGDGHGAEIVMGLDRLRELVGQGQNVTVNVVLQGDARQMFKVIRQENYTRTKATNWNALGAATT